MKKALLLLALACALSAQSTTNLAAVGVSVNSGASPRIAGTGLYARQAVASTGTWAFTVVDALPTDAHVSSVTTQVGAGIAQKVVTVAGVDLYIPSSAGISWNGSNTGWAWTTGGLGVVKLKSSWRILPSVRMVKSSVSSGTGYQLIGGVLIGWGW